MNQRIMTPSELAASMGESHPALSRALPDVQVVPTRYIRTPLRTAIAGEAEAQTQVDFSGNGPGFLIGHRGTAVRRDLFGSDEVVEAAAVAGVRMFFNGGENLMTDGESAQFVPFSDIYASSESFAPLLRFVRNTDKLTVRFINFAPSTSSIEIVPSVTFAFAPVPEPNPEQMAQLERYGLLSRRG